jgi:putative nucleotidyltransferase with HDIG domain
MITPVAFIASPLYAENSAPSASPTDEVDADTEDWLGANAICLCTVLLHNQPDRLRHSLLCGHQAEQFASAVPPGDRGALIAAAYLHDIGYSYPLVGTGFHPIDGARFLQAIGAPARLAALVAHHSEARMIARANGLLPALAEFRHENTLTSDALTYADMTAGPTGLPMSVEDRLADIARRHESEPELRAARHARVPYLLAAVKRVKRELTN